MEDVEPMNGPYRMEEYNRKTTATPLRRPNSSGKYLELTPLWETVIRYERLPHNVDKIKVFSELGVRLNDPEWEVRQHALRVLVDLIPVIAKGGSEELDSLMIPVVLTEITYNLGHIAPAVRKSAHDVILVYLKASSDPEFVLRSIVTHALESPAAKTNLTTSAIMCLPELLQSVVMSSETSGLGHQTLVQIVSALSRRLNQVTYQHHAVQSMMKIREVVGEPRFDHFLENYYPQVKHDLQVLCNVYQIESSNIRDSGIDIQSNVGSPPSTNSNQSECEVWSESSTSPVHNNENDEPNERPMELNINIYDNTVDNADTREEDEYDYADSDYSQGSGNEDVKVSNLSTENSSDVQEPEGDNEVSNGVSDVTKEENSNVENENNEIDLLLVENVQEEEDEEDMKRTPRRVRFGGEIVKLRTPDSDTVDIQEQPSIDCSPTEEINEHSEDQEEEPQNNSENSLIPLPQVQQSSFSLFQKQEDQELEVEDEVKRPRSSHIPLPIVPASKRPQDPKRHRRNWRQDSDPPDGVESLTSSSEGEQSRNVYAHQFQPDIDIQEVTFLDKDLKERLMKKDDWRIRVRALESVSGSVRGGRIGSDDTRRLLRYLVALLWSERSPRVVLASLRTLRNVTQAASGLPSAMPWLVPGLVRHLGPGAPVAVRLEAVTALNVLIRVTHPSPVVNVLFSDACIGSHSSKIRENTLLALLYSLMTFPSGEFACSWIAERIVSVAPTEPKRRVRQAILDTLAVLAQFVPRPKLRVDTTRGADSHFFAEALQARLARKMLPNVSMEGLILYALQIPNQVASAMHHFPSDYLTYDYYSARFYWQNIIGRDVEWVLAGSGSLSPGSAKSRSQLDHAQRAYFSPTESSNHNFSYWGKDPNQNFMAVGVGMPSRFGEVPDERGVYSNQNWSSDPRIIHPSLSQGSSRLYLSNQTGGDAQRIINMNGYDQGFPQLGLSYNQQGGRKLDRRDPMNQTWGGRTEHSIPSHVSIGQGGLPPLVNANNHDWTFPTWEQQVKVEPLQRAMSYGEGRQGRWSRRQDDQPRGRFIYVNGSSKENGFQPKPILHHSTPNLSAKSDPGIEHDLRHQQEVTRTPLSLPGTAPEVQRSPQSFRSEEHLSLKSVNSISNASLAPSSNHGNTTPPPPSPRPSVHSVGIEEQEEDDTDDSPNDSATETIQVLDSTIQVLDSTVPTEKTEVEDDEEREETVVHDAGRPDSEAGSESSQETQASSPPSRPLLTKAISQPVRKKKSIMGRPEVKLEHKLYPDSLPPYAQPKEALAKTLLQLDNPEWEVIMQGLEGLVRLARHHPKCLSGSTHQIAIHVTRHVRALRSQVARAACQASQQLFTSLGRGMDQEIEEMTSALLSRMADTNRFLRADSSIALDTLVDHSGPVKAIQALVNRGSKHQNAIVRGATCRLLLRICTRLGTERTMTLPKDTRDAVLITGAKCLTEGSLDTRRYAKDMFTLLSSDSRLRNIMTDVVPNNIMRNISKAMARIPMN